MNQTVNEGERGMFSQQLSNQRSWLCSNPGQFTLGFSLTSALKVKEEKDVSKPGRELEN
jgi:hypothetical protein